MALSYLFDPNTQFQNKNGVNNVFGHLEVFINDSDDHAPTYCNFTGTLNPEKIVLDNNGRAVVIVDELKTYRIEVYDRSGNMLWSQYPVRPTNVIYGDYNVYNADIYGTTDEIDVDVETYASGVKKFTIKLANAVKTVIGNIQDTISSIVESISTKADKVQGATAGNLAALDASGNLVDSGKKTADFKTKQTAVSVTGGTLKSVASMSQNANGEVTLTLNDIQDGTTVQKGVVRLNNAIDSTSTTEAATPKAVKDAYDALNNKIVARAVFLSQAEWAVQSQIPGDPAKVYYVENGTGEDAYTVYVWKDSTSEYVEVDESSIDLDGYWHDGPTTTGNGNVVTNITLGNDGVPQVEKGMSAEPAFSVLPVNKGGTGKTTGKAATNNLFSDINNVNTDPDDTARIVFKYGSPSDSNGIFFARAITNLWNYIQNKISSVLGLTSSSYGGKAATAGTADSANSVPWSGVDGRPSIPTKDSNLTNDRYVRFDANDQGLTDTQKSNARANIGAGTSNLGLGTTSKTAAYGNHGHGLLNNDGSIGDGSWEVSNADRLVIAKANWQGRVGYLVPAAIYFDRDEGNKALTQSAQWKEFLPPSGDGSSVSVTPDGTSTGTDIGKSTTLKVWAQKFKNLVGSLKALAFKDKVTNSDISGTISDSHISSASTWNGKQNALSAQTAYSAKGSATKVPQITTNSLGQVTGISEVAISGVTPSSHASTGTTYGAGTTANYGHVKLLNGDLNGKSYTDGVAAASAHTHSQYLTSHQSITTGVRNGSIAVSGRDVDVKGLGSLAYKSTIGTGDVSSGTYSIDISGSANSASFATGAANYTNDGTIASRFNSVDSSISGIVSSLTNQTRAYDYNANSLGTKGRLTIDTIYTPATSGTGTSHAPITGFCIYETILYNDDSNYGFQRATAWSSNRCWIRSKSGGTWSSWKEL